MLQCEGTKAWDIWPPTRQWPQHIDVDDASPPTSAPTKITIEPGEVLYIPQGWWHRATPADGPSLHITIGVNAPSGIDVLDWLKEQLLGLEVVRAPLPEQDDRGSHMQQIQSAVLDVLSDEDCIQRFRTWMRAHAAARRRVRLPRVGITLLPDHPEPDVVLVPLTSRWSLDQSPGEAVLQADGYRFTVEPAFEPVLRRLMSVPSARLSDVLDWGPVDEAAGTRALVESLVTHGLLGVQTSNTRDSSS